MILMRQKEARVAEEKAEEKKDALPSMINTVYGVNGKPMRCRKDGNFY